MYAKLKQCDYTNILISIYKFDIQIQYLNSIFEFWIFKLNNEFNKDLYNKNRALTSYVDSKFYNRNIQAWGNEIYNCWKIFTNYIYEGV